MSHSPAHHPLIGRRDCSISRGLRPRLDSDLLWFSLSLSLSLSRTVVPGETAGGDDRVAPTADGALLRLAQGPNSYLALAVWPPARRLRDNHKAHLPFAHKKTLQAFLCFLG